MQTGKHEIKNNFVVCPRTNPVKVFSYKKGPSDGRCFPPHKDNSKKMKLCYLYFLAIKKMAEQEKRRKNHGWKAFHLLLMLIIIIYFYYVFLHKVYFLCLQVYLLWLIIVEAKKINTSPPTI